jgi:predicted transcriptional regulator
MNFIQTVNLLATTGVTGAKQQILIWILWKEGPLTWKQLSEKTGGEVPTFQIQALRAKGLIEWEKTIIGKGGYTTYWIKAEALKYLNDAEKKQ